MEPQVKPAENGRSRRPDHGLNCFNGAASKTCGKLDNYRNSTSHGFASMEPQVKPAENVRQTERSKSNQSHLFELQWSRK